MQSRPRYPGIRVTANGNQLVSYHTETRIADAGVFYPITPSTEGGELYQQAFAEGKLNVFGGNTIAVETEGEHAAQGGAIAHSVCGKRVVNYTSGQGVVYGVEQYYHAPGKCSTMVLEVAARALTKHALNVHCGHDDVYGALDTGWIIVFGKDAQQAADQATHSAPRDGAEPHTGHERHGRLPDVAPRANLLQARSRVDPRVPSAGPTTSSTARRKVSASSSVRGGAACRG